MQLQKLDSDFTICKVDSVDQIDFAGDFVFLSKTPDEVSLVCESDHVPSGVIASESGWKGLKICGILDFDLIGIISGIAKVLADAGVGIFVVSTYNTDYILLKSDAFDEGVRALTHHGYTVT